MKGSKIVFDPNLKGFGVRKYKTKKVYVLYVTHNKKRSFHTIGNCNQIKLREARILALKKIDKIKNGERDITLSFTFKKWIDRVGFKHTSIKTSKARLTKLLNHFGDINLSSLTTERIQDYHADYSIKSPIEANRQIKLLKGILNKGVRWGYIKTNPARYIFLNKEKERTRTITKEEFRKLLYYLQQSDSYHAYNIVRLLILTGQRKSEIFKLKWTDIKEDKILIHNNKCQRAHYIIKSSAIESVINQVPRSRSVYLFPNKKGEEPVKSIKKAWNNCLIRAGIKDIVRHDIRRTCITWLSESGFNEAQIAKQFSHKSIQTTRRYTQLTPSKEIANELARKMLII